jgi:hypothetical protein
MHTGRNKKIYLYHMNCVRYGTSWDHGRRKRHGVYFKKSLKHGTHWKREANKAMPFLSQITKSFHYRDENVFPRLCNQYIRPQLEFPSSAWSP